MDDRKIIRIGLIGAGAVARRVPLPGFRRCPGVEVVGCCDPIQEAAESLGLPVADSDRERFLARDNIDAVVVAVPNYLHREVVLAALEAGKHVLCEKPLAMNSAQAREMLNAAQSAGRVHMTAFTYHFAPAIQYLKHLVKRGDLGEIRSVRAAYLMAFGGHLSGWRSSKKLAGSGVLADIGSHLIHLVRSLAGDIEAVSALERGLRNDPDSDVDDWAAFLAEFNSGACGTFEVCRLCPGRGSDITEQISVELYGAGGVF